MLRPSASYQSLRADFAWDLPERYNIAQAIADGPAEADPGRVCLSFFEADGAHRHLTRGELAEGSDAFANALADLGVAPGDRVALMLPQSFQTVVAHAAIYKRGAIVVPLALLFGPEALSYRLRLSGARMLVTTGEGVRKLAAIRETLPDLRHVVCVDGAGESEALDFGTLLEAYRGSAAIADTTPDTPALMIFTSGTTGPPKGALHGHRVLPGHLPGIQFAHGFLPQPGDRMWTPADWAWAGGLLNALMPALALGVPVVASKAQKFDPRLAFRILAEMDVRNAFIPPTALRMMMTVERPRERYRFDLRSVSSAGEPLGRETYEWARQNLGVTVNELYGQTECNAVIASCAPLSVSRAGAIGKAVPGHDVAVLDGDGRPVAPGVPGEIAVRAPDPVMFLGYWKDEAATRAKFAGEWLLTGDQATLDVEGYVTFFGRDDDIITSAGFRIGPSEIEDCLCGHPAVALAAVVGKPDAVRTEIVKAYVVLRDGMTASDALADELAAWVKRHLSAHEYPREIAFVDALPLTTTGKIIRRDLRKRAMAEADKIQI